MVIDKAKICLATVTTDAFVPGTLVMLHSFLKHNPWFQGDMVIIHDKLDRTSRDYFIRCFDRVRFIPVSASLKQRLQDLITVQPELAARQARFYSLEIFRLTGYDKVLFCDSDLLFRHSVDELFNFKQPLICCGDGAYYRGNARHAVSFTEIGQTDRETSNPAQTNLLSNTFNVGLLRIDGSLLQEEHYIGLLTLLSNTTWQQVETGHTDQVLYNRYFARQQTLVSCTYNYLMPYRATIYAHAGVPLGEAHVLHFNGPAKPWKFRHTLSSVQRDAALIQALKFWYDAYIECLKFMHFKGITSKI